MLGKKTIIATAGAAVLFAVSLAYADVKLKTDNEDVSLSITGDASMQAGQAVNYLYQVKGSQEFYHQWIQQSFLHLGIDAVYSKKLQIKMGIEGRLWFSLPDQSKGTSGQAYALFDKTFTYSIYEACGTYLFGNLFGSPLSFSITAGLFRYKYNPEIRNLGEYLFRSPAYPAVLINYFDQTDARLAGIKISADMPAAGDFLKLHGDLMLTLETEMYPFFDATPSFVGNCMIGNFLDVGLGVSLYHLFPMNDSVTRPQTDPKSMYLLKNGEANYYTFGGTKLMARLTFDPKAFIHSQLFGKEDLKVYSEAALLGLENYPANHTVTGDDNKWGYDTLSHKIPVVMGFNFPGFKVLDLISLELEWYGCTYPMNLASALRIGIQNAYPIPTNYNLPLQWYTSDNWKWSVYAKKMLANDHLSIVLQFARDHMRFQHILDEPKVYEEALVRPNDWWWTTKIAWLF
jgi:hypothetical protein